MTKKQKTLLHTTACVISVKELLDLIATSFTTGVEMTAVFNNHQAAIAQISDSQIAAYIEIYKQRASHSDNNRELFSFLSRLSLNLRTFRNNALSQNTPQCTAH